MNPLTKRLYALERSSTDGTRVYIREGDPVPANLGSCEVFTIQHVIVFPKDYDESHYLKLEGARG